MHLRSGDIRLNTSEQKGAALPFRAPAIELAEFESPATYLPGEPVEPSELVRYATGEVVSLPALLERAVRIVPERRAEALIELSHELDQIEDARLEELLPALRWLARSGRDENAPELWREFLISLQSRSEQRPSTPGLDLPTGLADVELSPSGLELP